MRCSHLELDRPSALSAGERPVKRRSHLKRFFIEEHVHVFLDAVYLICGLRSLACPYEDPVCAVDIRAVCAISTDDSFRERIEVVSSEACFN